MMTNFLIVMVLGIIVGIVTTWNSRGKHDGPATGGETAIYLVSTVVLSALIALIIGWASTLG